jgi:hypothetical protein
MSEHPLNQVFTTPHLPKGEAKGWVTLNDHLIKMEWKLKESLFITRTYKELCERVAAEAALMKEQTEVIIRYADHLLSTSSCALSQATARSKNLIQHAVAIGTNRIGSSQKQDPHYLP